MADPRDAQLIARAGLALYGEEWAAPLARALELNERTVRRIKAAAGAGAAYPVAPGALADLARLLRRREAELQSLAGELEGMAPLPA